MFIPIIYGTLKQMEAELLTRIYKHCLIKKAEECVDLPEKIVTIHKIPFTKNKQFKDLEKGVLDEFGTLSTPLKLVRVEKLHQLSNGYLYVNGEPVEVFQNPKLSYLKDMLEDLLEETSRVIIVY